MVWNPMRDIDVGGGAFLMGGYVYYCILYIFLFCEKVSEKKGLGCMHGEIAVTYTHKRSIMILNF